jgi:hypothetical protein
MEIGDFERAWTEAFTSMPTKREGLICRTAAEVEPARLEWLASFVPRGTVAE